MQRPCAGRDCGEATSLVDRGSRRSQGYGGDRNAGTVPGTEHGKKTAGFPCLRCLLLGLPPRHSERTVQALLFVPLVPVAGLMGVGHRQSLIYLGPHQLWPRRKQPLGCSHHLTPQLEGVPWMFREAYGPWDGV
jgi:hypothetical protein